MFSFVKEIFPVVELSFRKTHFCFVSESSCVAINAWQAAQNRSLIIPILP